MGENEVLEEGGEKKQARHSHSLFIIIEKERLIIGERLLRDRMCPTYQDVF